MHKNETISFPNKQDCNQASHKQQQEREIKFLRETHFMISLCCASILWIVGDRERTGRPPPLHTRGRQRVRRLRNCAKTAK